MQIRGQAAGGLHFLEAATHGVGDSGYAFTCDVVREKYLRKDVRQNGMQGDEQE
jgi:hypothetical protein